VSEPRYADLPVLDGSDVRHSWGVWGDGDRRGTANRITDASVLRALATPRTGQRFNLSLPLDYLDPPLYGRAYFGHRVFDRNRNMVEDEITALDPQSSSQWDSLRHIRAGRAGHYGGLAAEDPAVAELGIDTLVRTGLVLRGVLLDVPRWFAATGQRRDAFSDDPITPDELLAVAQHQGTTWAPSDLLLVRTGWLAAYREQGGTPTALDAVPTSAGLHAGAATAEFLWNEGFSAIACDNPAVEDLPGDPAVGSLHRRLIAAMGMPLGELWDLDGLAVGCAEAGRWECLVLSTPLHVPGGVASPANALAVL
jgi:hypothetical protein